jgi:hypothetical protein
LLRRIEDAETNIWYVPVLAQNDITKYEEIKNSNFIDGMKTLEIMINSIPSRK